MNILMNYLLRMLVAFALCLLWLSTDAILAGA